MRIITPDCRCATPLTIYYRGLRKILKLFLVSSTEDESHFDVYPYPASVKNWYDDNTHYIYQKTMVTV